MNARARKRFQNLLDEMEQDEDAPEASDEDESSGASEHNTNEPLVDK